MATLGKSKASWLTYLFYLVNLGSSLLSFAGITYNFETVFLLLDGGMFFVPLIWGFMVSFFAFNICFLLKGVSDKDSSTWELTVMFYEITAYVTMLVFLTLNVGLFYFGEWVETSHEAFLMLFVWINTFVGPFVLLSFGFLGLLHSMRNDLNSTLRSLYQNGHLAIIASAPMQALYQPLNKVEFRV